MAIIHVTENNFKETVQKGIVLLALQPSAIPAGALDEFILKAQALDMDAERRRVAVREQAVSQAAAEGGL